MYAHDGIGLIPNVMTRIQRRIFTRGAIVGALLTITIVAADSAGALAGFEHALYDLRARFFQFYTPKPTDLLVHVDIDDRALEQIGSWPWPRARLAAMLDEMRLAGVKAVALDVLFTEPQEKQTVTVTQADGSEKFIRTIDNDAEFAVAVGRLGNVVIPASLSFDAPNHSPGWQAIVDALRESPELSEPELVQKLGQGYAQQVTEHFLSARRMAMFERIKQEAMGNLTQEDLRRKLLPSLDVNEKSPIQRVFNEQFARWESATAIQRQAAPAAFLDPPPIRPPIKLVPVPSLIRNAAASGFVDFTSDRDGVLRAVPLLVELDGNLIPQLGMSLAMRTLGLQTSDLVLSNDFIRMPGVDGRQITIPVESAYIPSQGRDVGLMFNLPWFGGDKWEYMYDIPSHAVPAQHIPLGLIWAAAGTKQKIIDNNERLADSLPFVCEVMTVPLPDLNFTPQAIEDPEWQAAIIDGVLPRAAGMAEFLEAVPPENRDKPSRDFLTGFKAVRDAREENRKLGPQLKEERAVLAGLLAGKSALIGWTATGMLDVTPTSLHGRCPGVVAHGVVFNSLMTGDFWRRGPIWITVVATIILGLLAAVMASWLSPMIALAGTISLGAAYVVLNGLVLFDSGNLIVGLAGPLLVLALAWGGCTLSRIIVETSERARITRRFRSYVDPTLVTHVLENPDLVRLEGETRELTVVFTDLAGFTTISERLGEQTVPLLNDYMGRMVPIIRAQKGYVNKFLGDGIMFFFGAPVANSSHAAQAVEAVLEMQPAVERFNQELAAKGLPPIGMRAGISSGMMVVGDAGSAEASDYTVLGDTVNLGARLESANKAVGTKILMNARTAELLDGRFLLRPIGKLQVVGKEQGVMTYEAICLVSAATESQKELAGRTKEMVEAFAAGQFDHCIAIADAMDTQFGASDLTERYREECREYLKNPPDAGFDGRIKLSEK